MFGLFCFAALAGICINAYLLANLYDDISVADKIVIASMEDVSTSQIGESISPISQMLNIKNYPIKLFDVNNNQVYYEDVKRYWWKSEYDLNNNGIYYENSRGYWCKREYDVNGRQNYYENSNGWIEDHRNAKPITRVDLVKENLDGSVRIK